MGRLHVDIRESGGVLTANLDLDHKTGADVDGDLDGCRSVGLDVSLDAALGALGGYPDGNLDVGSYGLACHGNLESSVVRGQIHREKRVLGGGRVLGDEVAVR